MSPTHTLATFGLGALVLATTSACDSAPDKIEPPPQAIHAKATAACPPKLVDYTVPGHAPAPLFLSGVNLGNVQLLPFSRAPYVHSPAELKSILRTAFEELGAAGANSVRFWVHIDGSASPTFSDEGSDATVTGLPAGFLDDLKWVLRTAYENGILLNLSLWSHDILAVRRLNGVQNRDRAVRLIEDEHATRAYIDHALRPLIDALASDTIPGTTARYLDAVVAWEVMNEPEGISWSWRLYHNYQYEMAYGTYQWKASLQWFLDDRRRTEWARPNGGSGDRAVDYRGWYFVSGADRGLDFYMYKDVFDDYPSEWDYLKMWIVDDRTLQTRDVEGRKVQAFVNRIAGAIHRAAPGAKVSSAAHSMPYGTDVAMPGLDYPNAPHNYSSDADLVAAGGDPDGTLDVYQVHGYPEWSDARKTAMISMFENSRCAFALDKPVIVGEHWSMVRTDGSHVTPEDYARLLATGYAGAWGWAHFYVREVWSDAAHAWQRSIVPHENQAEFLRLLRALPEETRFPIPRSVSGR